MKFKNVIATGLIAATLFGATNPTHAQTKHFNDVPQGHWSEESIYYLADKDVISGYGNGNFGFGDKVTRGQVSAIISRYYGLRDDNYYGKNFADIKGHMFESNIKAVVHAGFMSGDNTDKFRPDDTLTRYEMAVILQKAFRLEVKENMPFNDIPRGHWATDYIRALYSNGITSGVGQNQYGGQYSVTREQFAKFMYNSIFIHGKEDRSSELINLAKSLGFVDRDAEYGTLGYNLHGKKADPLSDIITIFPYGNGGGYWDSIIFIESRDSAINEPIKALFNQLLPTKGDYLYSIVNNPNLPKIRQTFELDGRAVQVNNTYKLSISFGKVKK
ncbi:S-layer protein [Bacillus cereus]|uniref:S-layer protein n=1 Tax=Bacillus cereus TaxID=1396 RepID=A0A2B0LGM8_BACCE|nr:S-layer homology domain-containing protein [Bacillus cereus]PEX40000.1 S-layer protein [Bacillus cereus]PFB18003.1 S-layer protein [Bacillus cereus]PFC71123.1 S-layer protein [Bacillus cereus]PFK31127.1 S-layer protein [Bacillus cereus]PFM97145.1 S-layer protein [Bacillus cereus]